MYQLVGGLAALVLLSLYASTLTYVLRSYSRARLSEHLGAADQREWLDWLDRREGQLIVSANLFRLLFIVAIMVGVLVWLDPQPDGPASIATYLPAAGVLFLILMIVNVGLGHALAEHLGEWLLSHSLNTLAAARVTVWPLAQLLVGVEFVVRRLLGRADSTPEEENERLEEEILDAVSEGKAAGAVDEEQEDMIEAVFALHDTTVSAIMTPRTDISAIQATATLDEVRQLVVEAGHSRVPVAEDSLDKIVGILYVKDLVSLLPGEDFDVRKIMRPVQYVPEAKTIDELLREFRQQKVHIAVVLDEYGGTAGLVTIEDILEELVGEIDDEYDEETPPPINRIDAETLEVDARVHVSEVNEELEDLEVELPEDGDYETVGGFVFATLGKVPTVGEEVVHGRMHIKVISAEERKINRLRIRVTEAEKQPA